MRSFFMFLIISIIAFIACTKNSTENSNDSKNKFITDVEYVILPGSPEEEGEDWFIIKDFVSEEINGVPAVVQIDGKIYLPIMSVQPSFCCKVVKGYFVVDTTYHLELSGTVFQVNEHVRDTLLGVWGCPSGD